MVDAGQSWHGVNPYCLVVIVDATPTLIDLDKPGWLAEHAELMKMPARWILARKADSTPVLEMLVADGEEPYYRTKGQGVFVPPTLVSQLGIEGEVLEHGKVRSYGIGKLRADGHYDRLWVLDNGVVVAGDDVEPLADELAKAKLKEIIRRARSGRNDRQEGQAEGQGDSQEDDRQEGS